MESGSKIISGKVSTENFCEHAAISSRNSLPGDSSIAASSSQNSARLAAL